MKDKVVKQRGKRNSETHPPKHLYYISFLDVRRGEGRRELRWWGHVVVGMFASVRNSHAGLVCEGCNNDFWLCSLLFSQVRLASLFRREGVIAASCCKKHAIYKASGDALVKKTRSSLQPHHITTLVHLLLWTNNWTKAGTVLQVNVYVGVCNLDKSECS